MKTITVRLTRSELRDYLQNRVDNGFGSEPMPPYTIEGDAGTEIYVLSIPVPA